MSRGMLTPALQQRMMDLLEIPEELATQTLLRLFPYLMDCLLNNRNVQPIHINAEERQTLQALQDRGFVSAPASFLQVSEAFYGVMSELLLDGYVRSTDRVIPLVEDKTHD